MKKGGAAKGELILAIFELANCFRHGWGIPKDPVAAKQVSHHFFFDFVCICRQWTDMLPLWYHSITKPLPTLVTLVSAKITKTCPRGGVVATWMLICYAADAMNEAGWCYLEGFGCKKDKVCFFVNGAQLL